VKTPFILHSKIHTHRGIDCSVEPPLKKKGVPLVPSLISLPRVNMNERSARCHSPHTLTERSRLKGIIHQPMSPGRGPPLMARNNILQQVKSDRIENFLIPSETLNHIGDQDDRIEALERSPVAAGNLLRTHCRRVRGWFQTLDDVAFPIRTRMPDVWFKALTGAVRPLPPPPDLTRMKRGEEVIMTIKTILLQP